MQNGTGRKADQQQRPLVVVGVDGSPPARAALATALAAAARRGAVLEVLAVFRVDLYWIGGPALVIPDVAELRANAEKVVRELVEEVRADPTLTEVPGVADVPIAVVISSGPPAQELVEHSTGAQLLVVGNRGRGAMRSALLGSVALHCVTDAACPVLVVHGSPATGESPDRVVVGVDGSASSAVALASAVEEAARLGAAVEVVSTFVVTDHWSDLYTVMVPSADEIRADLTQLVNRMVAAVMKGRQASATTIRTEIVEGPAAEVLVRRARGARLLVVGSRGHGTLRGLLLGSVALDCAINSPCPVLVVRPPAEDAGTADAPTAIPTTADR
jgi:nucleotide-binding universal stress UspA family protein